jgi:hypothetical protein
MGPHLVQSQAGARVDESGAFRPPLGATARSRRSDAAEGGPPDLADALEAVNTAGQWAKAGRQTFELLESHLLISS